MREIGTAIEYLHNVNIAHRDIKVREKGDQHPNSDEHNQTNNHVVSLLLLPHFLAREPAVHIKRQKRCPQIDRLWFC